MGNRKRRAEIAEETVAILKRQEYQVGNLTVDLAQLLEAMRQGTELYAPDDLETLLRALDSDGDRQTELLVENCTTFAAARTLIARGFENPLCLNFASAKNPGGGFLSGSQAQEECLARASGLYESLLLRMEYYEINRKEKSPLYTNHLIYSPSVPVIRDDSDHLIEDPYLISIVTSPAANAGAVRKNEPQNAERIRPTMEQRIRSVLAVARQHQHNSLVLGAWGCGVFANDPNQVANWFVEALTKDPRFVNQFDSVVFAVLDFADGTPTFEAFQNAMPELANKSQPELCTIDSECR